MNTTDIINGLTQTAFAETAQVQVVTFGARMSFSGAEMQNLVNQTANYLNHTLKVSAGDYVGISSKNCIEWILLDLACLRLGVITCGFESGKFELNTTNLSQYQLRCVFTDSDTLSDGFFNIKELLEQIKQHSDKKDFKPKYYAPKDATTVKFTSGSTGTPKGLAARVDSINGSLQAVQHMYQHQQQDNLFVFLPLSLLQQRYWIYSALYYGHTVTVTNAEFALLALKTTQPTVIMGVPAFYEMLKDWLLQEPAKHSGEHDLNETAHKALGGQVRYMWTGSAPARADVLAFFNLDCNIPLFEGYGMNETCIVTKNHFSAHRMGSVGQVVKHKKVFLNAQGVVCVESTYPVNNQYLFADNPAANDVFLDQNIVVTGDLGKIDDDGYLYILGRADDTVVLDNGRNIIVRPIEDRITALDGVQHAVIIGQGKPFASLLYTSQKNNNASELTSYIKQQLSFDKDISKVLHIDDQFTIENGLLTSQYKLKRKCIVERYSDQIEQLYGANV